MKYIVILGDGMADLPSEELGRKTPLEVAYKPNIDSLAQKGICGICKTVPDGIKPGSDVANLSVMGYSPLKYYSGRSPLEALSIGVDMADDDLAVRCNLVTLSDEENYADKSMVDYSAGEISTEEAAELIGAVQQALGNYMFAFYSGVSYRHCLIKHHAERGTQYTPPHDISGKVIGDYLPSGLYGEEMLDLMVASYDILKDHPINQKRIAEGKNPANSIWLWGEGSRPSLPAFEELRGLKGAVISAVDLLKGIAIAGGMEVIEVEGATGTVKTNFSGKAKACVDAIREGYDYVYLHMEAPDECGHQGDSEGKVKSIELIDEKVVGYILSELEGEDLKILVCPDHPTPLITKTHSSEPVPFVIYDSTSMKEGVSTYTESECRTTGLVLNSGDELIELFLQKEDDMQKKEDLFGENEEVQEDNTDIAAACDNEDITGNEQVNDNEEASGSVNVIDNVDSSDFEQAEEQTAEVVAINSENVIFVDDSQNNESKIDTNSENEEQNAEENAEAQDSSEDNKDKKKGKKNKAKDKKSKKKKLLTILIAVAVLAVVITVSILTPILVINAPKILISSAEDFSKEVKNNKELYYLEKDITVDKDLTLSLNIDTNKKTLTVNGTLTLINPKNKELTIGVKSGKVYTNGGKITAKKLVIKSADKVNIYTNITADDIEVDSVKNGIAYGSIQANKSFDIKNSKLTFDGLAFGETIKQVTASNADITLNKAAKIGFKLDNSKLYAHSDIGSSVLTDTSELRLLGAVYNLNTKKYGTITGGKLVYVGSNGAFEAIVNAKNVWLDYYNKNNGETINCENVNPITILETPKKASIERDGSYTWLLLSNVDAGATKILVTIDDAKQPLVFEKNAQNKYDLSAILNKVGSHSIKIELRSDNVEFVKDSEPYYIKYVHTLTLEGVENARVEKKAEGYILTFEAVDFAESYEIVFDGKSYTIKSNEPKGVEISLNLSTTDAFKNLLTPGSHLVTIVAKSSQVGIEASKEVIAEFQPIIGKLDKPTVTIKPSSDGKNWEISWKNVDNAVRYEIILYTTAGEQLKVTTSKNSYTISKDSDITEIGIIAIGIGDYESSEEVKTPISKQDKQY